MQYLFVQSKNLFVDVVKRFVINNFRKLIVYNLPAIKHKF